MKTKNKEKIKFVTLDELKKELNLKPKDKRYINEGVRLYKMMHELREEKEKKFLNNEKLAQLSNIPRPEVSKILNGKVNVSLLRLSALARALGKELVITLK